MEEESTIINKNKYEKIISNMEDSINSMILYRSLYLIKKKFDLYKYTINKIYYEYNINKSKRIDTLGSFQIDINLLDKVLLLILKETNLFILELTSPKDIFLSYFLISNQKEKNMELIIQNIKKELKEKKLSLKYNKIFYNKKIKPLFQKNHEINNIQNNEGNNNDEIMTYEIKIVEYNKRGKVAKTFDELLVENVNNLKEIKANIINNESFFIENNNNINNINIKMDNNILYAETLPLIIADYIQIHKNIAIVEVEEELSKELDLLFNKELLIKMNECDELIKKYKNNNNNINIISKELNQYSMQLKQIQKSIILYERIIIDRKMKSEKTFFLEDMLNKLIEKETIIQQKINDRKQKIYSLNTNEKNINLDNNILKNNIHKLTVKERKLFSEKKSANKKYHPNKNYSSSSILITNQNNNLKLNTKNEILKSISKKNVLKSKLIDGKIKSALNEIFLYYSTLNSENNSIMNEGDDINNKFINLDIFHKFCFDFKFHILKSKINEIFNKYCNNNFDNKESLEIMDFKKFKSSLKDISLEMNSIHKQKLLNIIKEKKNIINFMELKECQRQEEEKNHNKFIEKITGRHTKKALERSQYDYISKCKKIAEDIEKYELDYENECKKNEKEILNTFYKYLVFQTRNFRNKLKNINNNHFLMNYKKDFFYNFKAIDAQKNRINGIKGARAKINMNNNLFGNEQSCNKNAFDENKNPIIKMFNILNENNILKLSTISNQKIDNSKLFQNSKKINLNQMKNIYFDPIYDNNNFYNDKNECNPEVSNFQKNNKSKKGNKLTKNRSAFELRGINNYNNILPQIILNNNLKNCNNLRYYNIDEPIQNSKILNNNYNYYNNEE